MSDALNTVGHCMRLYSPSFSGPTLPSTGHQLEQHQRTRPTEPQSSAVCHPPFDSNRESVPEKILDGCHEAVLWSLWAIFQTGKGSAVKDKCFKGFCWFLGGLSSFNSFMYCPSLAFPKHNFDLLGCHPAHILYLQTSVMLQATLACQQLQKLKRLHMGIPYVLLYRGDSQKDFHNQ